MYLNQVLYLTSVCYVVQPSRGITVLDLLKGNKLSNYLKLVNDLNYEPVMKSLEDSQNTDGNLNTNTPFIVTELSKDNSKDKIDNLNSVLVKRKVPHGLKQNAEYGNDIFYRPLVRFHKIDDMNTVENTNIDGNFLKIFGSINKKPLHKSHKKNPVLKKKSSYDEKEYKRLLKLLTDITRVIKTIDNKETRYNAYEKVVNILKSIDVLRTNIEVPEKSDEEGIGYQVVKEAPAQAPKLPHYPPWNYWTYHKTIHQDQCPDTQVKIGNMCIWTPPH